MKAEVVEEEEEAIWSTPLILASFLKCWILLFLLLLVTWVEIYYMANFVDVFSFFMSMAKESEIEANNGGFQTLLSLAARGFIRLFEKAMHIFDNFPKIIRLFDEFMWQ